MTTWRWKLRNFFYRLTHPSFWLQNVKTCYYWDEKLNQLLDKNPEVTSLTPLTCSLNGFEVWIGNYPYAYGGPWIMPRLEFLPAPLTRVRLKRYLERFQPTSKDLIDKYLGIKGVKTLGLVEGSRAEA